MAHKIGALDGMAVGCVVIAGAFEAYQQALNGSTPQTIGSLPSAIASLNTGRWNYLPLILLILGAALWVIRQLLPRQERSEGEVLGPTIGRPIPLPRPRLQVAEGWTSFRPEEVSNRKYERSELLLDGTHFRNCTFTQMHLYYDGTAPIAFTDCQFDEQTRQGIASHSPSIAQWMEIIRHLGWLREDAKHTTMPLEETARAVPTPTALPSELSSALGLDALPPRQSELTRIVGKTFERQTVLLDTFEYIGCKFADVKFVFNGGLYRMQDCTVDRSFSLQTANIIVLNTLALASILDFFKPEMRKAYEQIAVKAK